MTREEAKQILWDNNIHPWAILKGARRVAPDVAEEVDRDISEWIARAEAWIRENELSQS